MPAWANSSLTARSCTALCWRMSSAATWKPNTATRTRRLKSTPLSARSDKSHACRLFSTTFRSSVKRAELYASRSPSPSRCNRSIMKVIFCRNGSCLYVRRSSSDTMPSLRSLSSDGIVSEEDLRTYRHEPFRQKITFMMERLQRLGDGDLEAYSSARFTEDLKVVENSLHACDLSDLADSGVLFNLRVRVAVFGFHVAALDIRQHSAVHERAVSELFAQAGITADYASMPEDERLELLAKEIHNPRPLLPRRFEVSPQTRSVLDTMQVIAEIVEAEPAAMGGYIVSMTHQLSDLLEVILLAKEAGLVQTSGSGVYCPFDIVPLFETVEDLQHCAGFMDKLFDHDVYAAQPGAQ